MACVSQNSNEVQEQWRRNGLRARGEEDGAIFKLILYNQRLSVNVKILKFMGGGLPPFSSATRPVAVKRRSSRSNEGQEGQIKRFKVTPGPCTSCPKQVKVKNSSNGRVYTYKRLHHTSADKRDIRLIFSRALIVTGVMFGLLSLSLRNEPVGMSRGGSNIFFLF